MTHSQSLIHKKKKAMKTRLLTKKGIYVVMKNQVNYNTKVTVKADAYAVMTVPEIGHMPSCTANITVALLEMKSKLHVMKSTLVKSRLAMS